MSFLGFFKQGLLILYNYIAAGSGWMEGHGRSRISFQFSSLCMFWIYSGFGNLI